MNTRAEDEGDSENITEPDGHLPGTLGTARSLPISLDGFNIALDSLMAGELLPDEFIACPP